MTRAAQPGDYVSYSTGIWTVPIAYIVIATGPDHVRITYAEDRNFPKNYGFTASHPPFLGLVSFAGFVRVPCAAR
jgi:hypothetical protein